MRFSLFLLCLAFFLGAAAQPAGATESPAAQRKALAKSQRAVGQLLPNVAFTDIHGKAVHLSDFYGKPFALVFIYTSCAQSCPVLIETLAKAVDVAQSTLGKDAFSVAVVGFDTARDTPQALTLFAHRHDLDKPGWHFLAGDLPSVAALADKAGFTFFRSPKGFDHLDQVTIVNGKGLGYRQIYGATFNVPLLVEPLKDLVFGTDKPWSSPANLWKKIRLFCTLYDPATGRYKFNFSLFYQLFVGFTIIGLMIAFVARNIWRLRRRARSGDRSVPHAH